jgi:hypothetical protein
VKRHSAVPIAIVAAFFDATGVMPRNSAHAGMSSRCWRLRQSWKLLPRITSATTVAPDLTRGVSLCLDKQDESETPATIFPWQCRQRTARQTASQGDRPMIPPWILAHVRGFPHHPEPAARIPARSITTRSTHTVESAEHAEDFRLILCALSGLSVIVVSAALFRERAADLEFHELRLEPLPLSSV